LVAIRDALTAIIALPAPIREVVASLIAPRAKPNGEDPRPPAFSAARTPPRSSRRKLIGEWKRATPEEVRVSEGRLLDAMRAAPDAGVAELARRAGSNTSTVSMRLGRLAERGEVERIDGKWRVVEENPPKPALATGRA
jgi:MarR family